MHALFLQFQHFFALWGMTAVFAVLLLENFGLPLPGELALLYAGYRVGLLGLPDLIAIASAACIAGSGAGYWIGRRYGPAVRSWMQWLGPRHSRFEAFFDRHGAATIVLARFIAGLRMLAGPLAGLARMPMRTFFAYNVLGAFAWVSSMSLLGQQLGAHWQHLVVLATRADVLLLAAALAAFVIAWRRLRHGEQPHA